MKIALLSFEYPAETGFGGIGTYTWYQARALVRLGHEVHVTAGLSRGGLMHAFRKEPGGLFVRRFRAEGRIMRFFGFFGCRGWHWTRQRLENGWTMYAALGLLLINHKVDIAEMSECGAEGWRTNGRLPNQTTLRTTCSAT